MLHFLKLIRLPNLLVVVLTQALIYYHLIEPAFLRHGIPQQLTDLQFWGIALACVSVTAGGYVINDILDADGDAVNRPGTNQVYTIGLDVCRYLYLFFVLIGFAVSFGLSISLGQERLLWLYPLSVALLALYSRYIKPLPLVGNLLVALFCAGVPGLIALAELDGLKELWKVDRGTVEILIVYGLFAFLTTLLRELVKDMEDLKGDLVMRRKTLPVLMGIGGSKIIGIVLVSLNILAVMSPYINKWVAFEQRGIMIFLGLISLSLLVLGAGLLLGRSSKNFGQVSLGIKVVMLLGLGMLAVM